MLGSVVTMTFVYDAKGEMIAEYGNPESLPCSEACYVTVDALGSTRLLTDQGGATQQCYDYLPLRSSSASRASKSIHDGLWLAAHGLD